MPSLCTISGNLQDLTGTANAGYAVFALSNYGDNIPRVIGTSTLAQRTYTFAATAGVISGSLWGNDNIDPAGTLYTVTILDANKNQLVFAHNEFNITGASFNLNSATPVTTSPTVTPPTGDTTYLRTDLGNSNLLPAALASTIGAPLADKGGQVANVRAYGAKGDGVTDDLAAFNAAMNSFGASSGGILYVPPGIYRLSGTLRLNREMILRGAGSGNEFRPSKLVFDAGVIGIITDQSTNLPSGRSDWTIIENLYITQKANSNITLTNGSGVITGLTDTTMFSVNQPVSCAYYNNPFLQPFPESTVVSSIDSASQITVSNSATLFLGGAKTVADVSTTASNTTITSATANWAAGDAGDNIILRGVGVQGSDLYTTIASFTNSTTVVLTTAPSSTTSNVVATFKGVLSSLTVANSFLWPAGSLMGTGTTTAGSTSVTGVNNSSGQWVAGDPIVSANTVDGTYVTTAPVGASVTLTLRKNAFASGLTGLYKGPAEGILIRATGTVVRDCNISAVAGNGIDIVGLTPPVADYCTIERNFLQQTGGIAFHTEGADANRCTIIGNTASYAAQGGFIDGSTIGNDYISNHAQSVSPLHFGSTINTAINTWYGSYNEGTGTVSAFPTGGNNNLILGGVWGAIYGPYAAVNASPGLGVFPGGWTGVLGQKFTSGTAAPASGAHSLGDIQWNTTPSELGSAGSKYTVIGFICTVAGTPGTWLQMRALTGN